MPFKPGTTFQNKPAGNLPSHLWVVVSDPRQDTECILSVNVTSWKEDCVPDGSCVLEPGDHPFIKHKSFMKYSSARTASLADLQGLVRDGMITLKTPVREEILERIRNGACVSPYLKGDYRHLLIRQGLLRS